MICKNKDVLGIVLNWCCVLLSLYVHKGYFRDSQEVVFNLGRDKRPITGEEI